MRRANRGLTVVEYAMLIAIVLAATVAMQMYIKRGFQGRLRKNMEQLSEGFYEPGKTFADNKVTKHYTETRDTTLDRAGFSGKISRTDTSFKGEYKTHVNEIVSGY